MAPHRYTLALLVGLAMSPAARAVDAGRSPLYETVNASPQFSSDADQFSFYWAVWRSLAEAEKSLLQQKVAVSLVSRRHLSWSVSNCKDDKKVHEDEETFWFLDPMQLDRDGRLVPIPEAPRRGYLYFSLVNLNSAFLRGMGPFSRPKRRPGQPSVEHMRTLKEDYQRWWKAVSPRGFHGVVTGEAIHRSLVGPIKKGDFVGLEDYQRQESPLHSLFLKYSPMQWPIAHDERAHKLHALHEPSIWSKGRRVMEETFHFRIEWDWCGPARDVQLTLFVPDGKIPGAGPTRPDRPDEGLREVPIRSLGK